MLIAAANQSPSASPCDHITGTSKTSARFKITPTTPDCGPEGRNSLVYFFSSPALNPVLLMTSRSLATVIFSSSYLIHASAFG
jgi:hypothetical protein